MRACMPSTAPRRGQTVAERITLTELGGILDKVDSYNAVDKRNARESIRVTLMRAYQNADEASMLREMMLEQARTIARLEVEVERLRETLFLKPPTLNETEFTP
jgi:hypothetical protein